MNILPIKDVDGNIYHPVKIGSQIWLKENLKVTHYINGDQITMITDNYQWTSPNGGAYFGNISTNGRLYNWFVVQSNRVCPKGWHVPSMIELKKLVEFLGGENTACSQLANLVDVGNAEEICYNGVPSNKGHWWSSTKEQYSAWSLCFIYSASCSAGITCDNPENNVLCGFYIKCIKNE